MTPELKPVLLAPERSPEQVRNILSSYRLMDIEQADRNLQAMAGGPPERRQLADILPILLDSIARTADPDQALNHWERMLSEVTRSSFLDYLHSSPRMLDLLCTIFGNSDALAFTIIRDPMLVYWLAEEACCRDRRRARESNSHFTRTEPSHGQRVEVRSAAPLPPA